MPNFRLLPASISLIVATLLAQQGQAPDEKTLHLQAGVILPRVTAMKQPEQSYALYLPSAYSQDKLWPIIYAFDPGARGSVPVELMKEAAERNSYILVGSNNSRNGSWKIEAEAAEAIIKDTHARLSIDDRRVYFAGFSGGARVAAQIAQVCKCAAGVLQLKPGQELIVYVFDGSIRFSKPRSIKDLRGIAKGMKWKDDYRDRNDRF